MKISIKTVLLVFFAIYVNSTSLYGQSSIPDSKFYNMRPAISSPNAAALEKYVEFPAANYTGVPEISIPIHEPGVKGVRIPIALSYHASGIKVDEVASDVGIGWSLNAGGAINIIKNGLLDEVSGYPSIDPVIYQKIKNINFQNSFPGGQIGCASALMYSDPYPFGPDPYNLYAGNSDFYFLWDVIRERADAEPDLYTFNFLGRTGKFFQDSAGIFRTIPYSEMRVERLIENNAPAGYKITDETGSVYEFKLREESSQVSVNLCNSLDPQTNISRSYYLTKVTTTNNETVTFHYGGSSFTYDLQKQFTRAMFSRQTSCWNFNNDGIYYYRCQTNNTLTTGGVQLDSIKISDGTLVKFAYSGAKRTDIGGNKYPLSSIEIWDNLFRRKKIKKFSLAHTYLDGRLTLASIQEEGKPTTTFTYNDYPLPERLSYSQDHYGYFNGKFNTTLLPMDEFNEFWDGANREVDTLYTQARILTKISHATGGYTEFFYGANRYLTTAPKFTKITGPTVISQPNQTTSQTFIVPSGARKIRIVYTNTYDGTVFHNDECKIYLNGPNGYARTFVGNSTYYQDTLSLVPGTYTLSIQNAGSTYQAEATIFWFMPSPAQPHVEIGGGVRIKEIKKIDGSGAMVLQKRFDYSSSGTTHSSGINTMPPIYIDYRDEDINRQGQNTCPTAYCQFTVQNSNCIAPISFANGHSVIYSEVTTFYKEKNDNGYSTFKYIVNNDGINNSIPAFPYSPGVLFDWMNGSLLEQNEFAFVSGQFKQVRKVKNFYNYINFDRDVPGPHFYKAYGAKISPWKSPFICLGPCQTSFPPLAVIFKDISFGIQRYHLYSSWHRLEKTEVTDWDANGSNPLVNITAYFYDNPNSIQVSRVENINSKGERMIQKMRYARDYSSFGFIQNLLSKNVVAIPIEKYRLRRDGSNVDFVLNGEISTFKPSAVLTDKIYALEISSPIAASGYVLSSMNSSGLFGMDSRYKERLSLNSYNSIGNVSELQKFSDVSQSYLWDYASVNLISEVKNASLSSIAYTSFEADGAGNWSGVVASSIQGTGGITGRKYYSHTGFSLSKNGLSASSAYTVTYWSKNGGYSVNGATGVAGRTSNGWTLYEHLVTGQSTITVTGSGAIDELRLHPRNAMMTTYTYEPLVGVTSQTDANNRTIYYEYDSFNRLFLIRDQDGKILKKYCYNYQGQQEDCTVSTSTLWQNTATAVRCKLNSSNQNTGEQEQEQVDNNPYSATYGQTRWIVVGTNTSVCPLPVACTTSTCSGLDKKCINNICRTGYKVYTSSEYDSLLRKYVCIYHYVWSDGSWSQNYTEISNVPCGIAVE